MPKLARVPANDGPPRAFPAEVQRIPRSEVRYYAFLSYSHKDEELADWLHRELEEFRVPRSLAGKLTANGAVPRRLTPIFRDEHELGAANDLGEEIREALEASQFLIVLCSPHAAKSHWTNAEIESFKRRRPDGCVLAAIASGEPFASEIPGREGDECFPPALRQKYDRRGRPTGKRAEPLAADLREDGETRRIGFLKLVAGMLGVGLDDLVQREATRRHRRLAWLAGVLLAGMAVTSGLAFTAIQARDAARDQRREAEGLVSFMLGDLKDKLEPIGRLDALDGVGSRVLAYYSKQDTRDLSDDALLQRSRALSLMGQVANSRGDFDGAIRLYRAAMAGTAEAIRRDPSDPQRLFDHAQNVFYIGQIALDRSDYRTFEANMREYQRLAVRMMELDPDNIKWRMEKQYADTNLAVALFDQRRFPEAVVQFSEALRTMEAIAALAPDNRDYQQSVSESLAWLADAKHAIGDYEGAIAARRQGIGVLEQLLARTGDAYYQERLVPARRNLGILYDEHSQIELAGQEFRAAADQAAALTSKEPANKLWLQYGYVARENLAVYLLQLNRIDEATAQTSAACQTVSGLLRQDSTKPEWRRGLSRCRGLQARLALATGAKDQALKFAQAAVAASKTVHGGDVVADAYLVGGSYRLYGDVQRLLRNETAARSAWTTALTQLPSGNLEPDQMAERATILDRLGRTAEAEPLHARLRNMGYRKTM